MLHLQNISKSFGGARVLQDVSLDVPAGQITALVGPNGAGKTTLFDVITGAVLQDEGRVTLSLSKSCNNVMVKQAHYDEWIDLSNLEIFERARLGISRTFQQVKLCENLTVLDHCEMVKDNDDERLLSNIVKKSLRRLGESAVRGTVMKQPSQRTEHYAMFLKSFAFDKPLETRVLDLSYGQRKLLDLGLALLRKHSILLLDEPVAGVNQIVRKTIHKLLAELKTKNETILLIEHDIEFVRAIADTVVVLDEGRVLTQGTPSEVFSNRRVIEAYLGE